jgi:hypothetical protein
VSQETRYLCDFCKNPFALADLCTFRAPNVVSGRRDAAEITAPTAHVCRSCADVQPVAALAALLDNSAKAKAASPRLGF